MMGEQGIPYHPPGLADRRRRYREALEQAVARITAQLAALPQVERAILFGSYAAGRRDLFTDLDILVVMHSTQDFVTRTAELTRLLATDVDLDLLVYTPEELEQSRARGFIRRVLATGQVIYERRSVG